MSPERDRAKRSRCSDILDSLQEEIPPVKEIEYFIKCLNTALRQEADIACMNAQQIETHPLIKAAEALGELLDTNSLNKIYGQIAG